MTRKVTKKMAGGAEVAHQGQAPQADAGEQDEAIEVPLGKELIQSSGPGIDIGHLDQFRGLEADTRRSPPSCGRRGSPRRWPG